ncbi:hypothetical protein VL20_5716 [Microcystis panniformis FACHB-1757]|uniref:Uncharacterized protein n=1 Tax=Microcystis panniformis FACHB-1757 TaxID=1638788 RepID=A0A0K1S8T2_9CHRO|nr:hypothetical protein VL20_5716 [Microcystis panniformis FACHB-1757]
MAFFNIILCLTILSSSNELLLTASLLWGDRFLCKQNRKGINRIKRFMRLPQN